MPDSAERARAVVERLAPPYGACADCGMDAEEWQDALTTALRAERAAAFEEVMQFAANLVVPGPEISGDRETWWNEAMKYVHELARALRARAQADG